MRTALARAVTVALVLVATATQTSAQEKGTVGLTMGYPASVGLLWHATERVAIRPAVTVSRTSTTVTLDEMAFPYPFPETIYEV